MSFPAEAQTPHSALDAPGHTHLVVELPLQGISKVIGHLPEGIAGCVSDPVVGVLAEWEDNVHHVLQDGLHLLATPLTDGRDGHESGVPVPPVLCQQIKLKQSDRISLYHDQL